MTVTPPGSETNQIIFLFGASCSGKSTLGVALQKDLRGKWTYIDRDALIEEGACTDDNANLLFETKIEQIKTRIIIDAQIPWREKRDGELYFLIDPPLDVLLKRNDHRNSKIKRAPGRALQARNYVIQTHETLSHMEQKIFDHCFDSSQFSIPEEMTIIKKYIYLSLKDDPDT